MAKDAASSSDWPNYHATLTDGTTEIPFVFSDGKGNEDLTAFSMNPYPRQALKTTEGDSEWSDLEPPYFAKAQDDFTGGRGNEDFESDTSRYFDGHNVDTNKESGVVLTGRETYSTGYRNADFSMPGSISWQTMYVTAANDQYHATSFVSSANYTSYQCEVWLRRWGSPANIKVELWSESGGEPNAMLASKELTAANVTSETLRVSILKDFVWTGSPGLDGSSTFWVVVIAQGSDNATNYWELGASGFSGKQSTDGSSWSGSGAEPYFRITPAAANFVGKFFEYKRGLYMVTQPADGSNSKLYINGDRGTADSNSGDPTNLEDSSKSGSWTADEWIGDVVLITKGPGSDEDQNWRVIDDNDTTSLQVSPDWNINHTTATEYVILGSDKWTVVEADLDYRVVDVAVAGEYIYFTPAADETTKKISRYRYYTSSGAWSTFNGTETSQPRADKLMSIRTSDGANILFNSNNALTYNFDQPTITKSYVPEDGTNRVLFYDQGSILPSLGASWTGTVAGDVTYAHTYGAMHFAIDTPFTTGTFGIHNFDTPVDISNSERIKMLVMSSINTGSTDIDLLFDDVEDLGKTWSPDKILHADYAYDDLPTKVFLEADFDGTPAFTDLTETYDGDGATNDAVSFTQDDYLWVGYSAPFNKIYFDLGTTVNDVVCDTPDYTYSSAKTNTALPNLADTTKTGTTPNRKPLNQDGTISFNTPKDWQQRTINSVEAYWVRIHYDDADLTASVNIKSIYVTVDYFARMTPLYTDLINAYDATPSHEQVVPKWAVEDFVYIGNATKFNIINVTMNGNDNVETSTMTAAYHNGSAWTSVTITDNTKDTNRTLYKTGTITFTIPEDWESSTVDDTETYWIRLDVSANLTTDMIIDEITVTRQDNLFASLPALVADTWTWVYLAVGSWAAATPDKTSIKSIGLEIDNNLAALDFYVKDVRLAVLNLDDEQILPLPASFRINGMEAYSGNADDPVENPWIFTEKGVYEIQTQNDDQVVAIPLKELATLQSSENGVGHTVNGTYLFFNIGEKIERYFNRTLDDVGPDRDEGLPTGRPGIPVSMTSYPGRIYAAIDANTGTSSVLTMRGTAWSEVYRAPRAAERIRSVYLQAIPGTNVDRLWFSMGSDILWVPVSLHPYNETDFNFQHEGHLITSWIYAGMMDVEKLWKSLKLFSELPSNCYILADYQVDDDTTWTYVGFYQTAPMEELDIASTLPNGKRIRFRLRFWSSDVSESPRLKAIVTEGAAFVPVKNSYSFTFAMKKGLERIDLDGLHDDTLIPAQVSAKLKTWANDGQVLTFEVIVPMADSSTVFINPQSLKPLIIVPPSDTELYVSSLTVFDA